MNDLAALLTSFDMRPLFDVSEGIARSVGMFLAPVLLLVSIYIRLMETQLDGLAGGGKYGAAFRDIVLWTFVLGSYYAIGNLIFGFFNPVYVWLDSHGSLAVTMKAFADLMEKNKVALDGQGMSITQLLSTPYALVAILIHSVTLVLAAFVTAFLKLANVLTFGVAFIWGLIAIPVSISTTFRILRGWALLLAFALVWPVVQGILMWMFSELFLKSAATMVAVVETDATLKAANLMMMFSVLHLLLAAVMVAAPFIAMALVSNSSAASGIVMPFVAAASAAGVATFRGAQVKSGGTNPAASGLAGSSNGFQTPSIREAYKTFASNNSARAPEPVAGGNVAGTGSPTPAIAVVPQPRNAMRQNMKEGDA